MGKSNQKSITVKKEECDKQHYYTQINLNALFYAMKELSGDAFKLWVYFSKNQPNYSFDLSSKHAEETLSLSKRRYDNSIKELIDGGFLVDTNTDPKEVKNQWTFYELPLVNNQHKPLQQNDTSLGIEENKPCLSVDTRNITENTNKEMKNREPIDISSMTQQERQAYFSKNVF